MLYFISFDKWLFIYKRNVSKLRHKCVLYCDWMMEERGQICAGRKTREGQSEFSESFGGVGVCVKLSEEVVFYRLDNLQEVSRRKLREGSQIALWGTGVALAKLDIPVHTGFPHLLCPVSNFSLADHTSGKGTAYWLFLLQLEWRPVEHSPASKQACNVFY